MRLRTTSVGVADDRMGSHTYLSLFSALGSGCSHKIQALHLAMHFAMHFVHDCSKSTAFSIMILMPEGCFMVG